MNVSLQAEVLGAGALQMRLGESCISQVGPYIQRCP